MGLMAYNPLRVTEQECIDAWHAAPWEDNFLMAARGVCAAIHSLLDYKYGDRDKGQRVWRIEPENAVLYVGRSYQEPQSALFSRWADRRRGSSSLVNYYFLNCRALRPGHTVDDDDHPREDERNYFPHGIGDRSAVVAAAVRCDATHARSREWEKALQRFLSLRHADGKLCVSALDWDIKREGLGGEPEPKVLLDRTAVIYIGLRPRMGPPKAVERAYRGGALERAARDLHDNLSGDGCRAISTVEQALKIQKYAQRHARKLPEKFQVDHVLGV